MNYEELRSAAEKRWQAKHRGKARILPERRRRGAARAVTIVYIRADCRDMTLC